MIPDVVRQSMEKGIRKNIESYRDWDINHKRGTQMWHYDHEIDFWYGHMVGSLQALSNIAFKDVLGRLPNSEEQNEIQEMIQVEGSKIQDLIKNWT